MMYSIIVTIVSVILICGAFRDERTKREQTRQIEYLKKQNHEAWENTRQTEEETGSIRSGLQKQIDALQKDADRLRKMIWDYIGDQHAKK